MQYLDNISEPLWDADLEGTFADVNHRNARSSVHNGWNTATAPSNFIMARKPWCLGTGYSFTENGITYKQDIGSSNNNNSGEPQVIIMRFNYKLVLTSLHTMLYGWSGPYPSIDIFYYKPGESHQLCLLLYIIVVLGLK